MDYRRWCVPIGRGIGSTGHHAAVSLECAIGLPGSECLSIPASLKRLDEWAGQIRQGIGDASAEMGQSIRCMTNCPSRSIASSRCFRCSIGTSG